MAGGDSGRYCPPTAVSTNGSLGFHRHGPLWATAATANCRIIAICAASRGAAKARRGEGRILFGRITQPQEPRLDRR
jgi:hypothetical protein